MNLTSSRYSSIMTTAANRSLTKHCGVLQAGCWHTPSSPDQASAATLTSTRTRPGRSAPGKARTWRSWLPTSSVTPWDSATPVCTGPSWRPTIPTRPAWSFTRTTSRASSPCMVSVLCQNPLCFPQHELLLLLLVIIPTALPA